MIRSTGLLFTLPPFIFRVLRGDYSFFFFLEKRENLFPFEIFNFPSVDFFKRNKTGIRIYGEITDSEIEFFFFLKGREYAFRIGEEENGRNAVRTQ